MLDDDVSLALVAVFEDSFAAAGLAFTAPVLLSASPDPSPAAPFADRTGTRPASDMTIEAYCWFLCSSELQDTCSARTRLVARARGDVVRGGCRALYLCLPLPLPLSDTTPLG